MKAAKVAVTKTFVIGKRQKNVRTDGHTNVSK